MVSVSVVKHFNTAGPCRPDWHYMLPPEGRLSQIPSLIERGQYFLIHAPRQTGKTTLLLALSQRLNAEGRYVALYANVESAQVAGGDLARGIPLILTSIAREAQEQLPPEFRPDVPDSILVPGNALREMLTTWAEKCRRPVVLFIDEIDALQDETLLSVLRQLRSGYKSRPVHFPHSIALVGLRDIRDYKVRIRPERESLGTASPFNIITESLTLRNFTRAEVNALYGQHTAATGQQFSEEAVALAFELTQGQPWLVNALARQIVEQVVPFERSGPGAEPGEAPTIQQEHVQQAKEILIERRDCHLDSLVDKLREPRVKRIVESILIGETMPMDVLNDDLVYARDLGLISTTGTLKIANPIYAEVIPRALSWGMQLNIAQETAWYVRADGSLDMPALLRAFQAFFRQHSEAWLARFEFQEAGPHLMLMAFLQRIVNSGGIIQREFAIGSGRADIVILWPGEKHVVELKVRYNEQTEEEGRKQLGAYLERLGLNEGYLVLFDRRREVDWEQKIFERTVEQAGRRIHVFGV